MRQVLSRVAFFLLAIVLLGWISYHIINYNAETITTETVFKETISRSISGRGIAIREEIPLEKIAGGAERYIYEDGTRVGIGQTVVEYYTGSVENRNIQNISKYEEEILMLEDAQNKNINNFSTASIISRDIREQLANLSETSKTGNCTDTVMLRRRLTELVNRREIAVGKADNYQERIDELKSSLEILKSEENLENIQQGNTPVSGFFAKSCDGYEKKLDPAIFEEYTVDDYLNAINSMEPNSADNTSGRIITNSNWFFAITAPVHEIEWVKVGQFVELSFGHISKPIPAKVSQLVIENKNDTAIIVFTSDYITEDIVNLRNADANVAFTQFSGLRIDTTNIRFETDKEGNSIRGIYVLKNGKAVFKYIDSVYEEEGFVLSKTNFKDDVEANKYVQLYDKVIVKGNKDIQNGKIV